MMKIKLLVSLWLACLMFTGCQTVGKTLASTAVTVDAAMQGWATYVAMGNATAPQELQVKTAYLKYQASMKIAKDAYLAAETSGEDSIFDTAALVLENNAQALIALIQIFQQTTTVTPISK